MRISGVGRFSSTPMVLTWETRYQCHKYEPFPVGVNVRVRPNRSSSNSLTGGTGNAGSAAPGSAPSSFHEDVMTQMKADTGILGSFTSGSSGSPTNGRSPTEASPLGQSDVSLGS
eukprot:TRINITY_DN2602_c0_g3_i1.p1 TRINITY_DN2602_c0_g3~~TRINITY_DN2602_c0_g3_i1.p1  ORF type:complete len:115 (+),score=4.59 TRINITY_DN2602_c0_g3_i1:220-564(+)